MADLLIRLIDIFRNLRVVTWNFRRRLFRTPYDFIVLELQGGLPEYLPPAPWWRRFLPFPGLDGGPGQLDLESLREILERIANDPQPAGIVVRLDGLSGGWRAAESARLALERFRRSGKRVIAYAEDFDLLHYYVACSADEILAPSIAGWNVIGLRMEAIFVKEVLDRYGVEVDVIAVSPYKTAGDALERVDMSPEQRENLDQLLDGIFEELTQTISISRGIAPEEVREWIDRAPLRSDQAVKAGLFDAVAHFDELRDHLARENQPRGAQLISWSRAQRLLSKPIRWRSGKAIGVVSMEGMIVSGSSRRLPLPISIPFLGNVQAGSDSLAQALRRAEKNPRIAAVVLYVDSRGGSSLASEMIWREVARLRRKMPCVIYFGDYAASGGYYVASDAEWIVANPLTITGSIGVVVFRLYLDGLLARLKVNRVSLVRGKRADLFGSATPLTEELRQILENYVADLYDRFKERVGVGRRLPPEQLEQVSGGRVWTGRQALELSLLDQLGDLQTAVEKARQLAGLPSNRWTPAVWVSSSHGNLLPDAFPTTVDVWADWLAAFQDDRVWMIDPFHIVIR